MMAIMTIIVVIVIITLYFVDLNVAFAEGTFFRRAARDGNGEPVVSAGLSLIRHGDDETAGQTVDGAGAGEGGGLADNQE